MTPRCLLGRDGLPRTPMLHRPDEHLDDALDAIDMVQRDVESHHAIRPACKTCVFFKRFAAFAAVYAIFALAWCLVIAA